MDQLHQYLAEQGARRVDQLRKTNSALSERLRESGVTPSAPPSSRVSGEPSRDDSWARLGVRLANAEARVEELQRELDDVLKSRSWRLLRFFGIARR
jgi:hypothetical protein